MKICYPVSVELRSALHINGGTDVNGGRVMVKMNGKPYIPASLFKGMVRENFTRLWGLFDDAECNDPDNADVPCDCIPCRMFGKAGFQRSRIFFDDLTTDMTVNCIQRANVSIDRYLRKNVDNALVFTETADRVTRADTGETVPVVFTGEMTVHYPLELTEERIRLIEAVLIEAVKGIDHLGSGKSRGLGSVKTSVLCPDGGFLCAKR